MAISSLRNIVDGSFVRKFQGLATGTSAVTKGGSSSVSIQTGLRVGAQTFARAVQGLNGIISYLNVGKSTLEGLIDITDKMVDLTKRATKVSGSADSRNNLNEQFFKLARDYERIVSDAKFGDRDLLTTEGISGIFQVLGLDKDASESIAAVFEKFVVPKKEDNLASEAAKGTRPYNPPPSAYVTRAPSADYVVSKLTDSNPTSGFVTQQGAVFTDTDDILNQNPGHRVLFNVSNDGSLSTMEAGTVSSDVTLRGASQTTGYSVFESTDNFLGYNPSGYNQIFVADAQGNVVHQVTNNAGSTTYNDLSSLADSKTILIESVTAGVRTLATYTTATLGDDPALSSVTVIDTLNAADDFENVFLNVDNSYVGYIRDATPSAGSRQMIMKDTATLTTDAWLAAQTAAEKIGVTDDDQLILQFPNGGNKDLMLYNYGDGAYTSFITNQPISQMIALPRGASDTQGYVATLDSSQNLVSIYGTSDGSTPIATYDFDSGDTITLKNLVYNSAGTTPQLAIYGSLPSISGDSDNELYRLGTTSENSTGRRLARSTAEYEEIFDRTLDLKTRPNAYRMLHDLEGLQKQLKDNVKAMDGALEIVGQNINLVRAAGFAFLDLSNQASDSRDADQIAEDLRIRIRKDAKGALSQAENLQAIVVAALAFESSQLTSNT